MFSLKSASFPYDIDGKLLHLWYEVEEIFGQKITLEIDADSQPAVSIPHLAPVIHCPSPKVLSPWILAHELMHLKFIGQEFPQLYLPNTEIETIVRNIDQPFDHAAVIPAVAELKIPDHPDPIALYVSMHEQQIDDVYPQLLSSTQGPAPRFNIASLACYVFDVNQFSLPGSAASKLEGRLENDNFGCFQVEQLIAVAATKLNMSKRIDRLRMVYILGTLLEQSPVCARYFTPGLGSQIEPIDPTILQVEKPQNV